MAFFCDWINVWQQFPRGVYPDYLGGRVVSVQGSCGISHRSALDHSTGAVGEEWVLSDVESVDYSTPLFSGHRGSYETNLLIRMVDGRLEVRGNPSSWGRLDNVFGVGLDRGIEIYNEVLADLGLPQFTTGEMHRYWLQSQERFVQEWSGCHLTRVDMTQNVMVGMGNVPKFHQWLASQKLYRSSPGTESLQKYSDWDWNSVYLSESKFWVNVKSYDPGEAIEDVKLPEYKKKLKRAASEGRIAQNQIDWLYNEAEGYLGRLACWCAEVGLARQEWSYRSRWFAQSEGLGHWVPKETESELLQIVMKEAEKISGRAVVRQVDMMENLTDKEFRILNDWKMGSVVRDVLSKSAFYRFRASIREKTGYDIAARPVGVTLQESRPVYFQMKPASVLQAPSWYRRAA